MSEFSIFFTNHCWEERCAKYVAESPDTDINDYYQEKHRHNIFKNTAGHKSNTGQSTSTNLVPVKSAPYRGSIVFKYRVVTEGQSACADTDLFIVPVRHK